MTKPIDLAQTVCGKIQTTRSGHDAGFAGFAAVAVQGWVMKKFASLLLFFFLVLSSISFAQGLGSIVGTITDPSGAVLPKTRITAIEMGTGISRTTVADLQGYYVIASLKPAQYLLSIESSGFRTEKEAVTLQADQSLTVNAQLQLGAPTETIEVTGTQVQVDTTTSTLKQVVESQRITDLPLNGRNPAELSLQVAGVVNSANGGADQGATKTFPGGVTYSVNGSRQNQISYQLDGGNFVDEYTNINQPFPFPDALQEFSVQTSNYGAEYGQNAGGVVNVVTKSGTNQFHGDAFEFLRNAVLNARNWASDFTAKDHGRDQLKRNQFGGTFGGPVIHDRTFFFVGYQGTRIRNLGSPTTASVLTAAQRAGVTDPAVAKLLTFIPQGDPNNLDASGQPQVTYAKPDRENFDEFLGRFDHSLTASDRLTFRYDRNRFHKDPIFDPTNILDYADGTNAIVNQNYLIHESHVFSGSLLNDFRFSYARETSDRGPSANVPSVADLGVNIFQPSFGKAIQSVSVSGLHNFSFGDNPHATFKRNNFTWSDDLSVVRGRHTFQFGGVIESSRIDVTNPGFFGYGTFSFSSLNNFLKGTLNSFQQGAGEFKNNRDTFPGLYAQDTFHVARRLTLTAGLRWEPFLAWNEVKNRTEVFQLANAVPGGAKSTLFTNAPPGLFFAGDPGIPQRGVPSNFLNFAPRIGFAYDVFGDGKTSLRGGSGFFYDTRVTGIINNRVVDLTPFSPQVGPLTPVPGPFSDPYCQKTASCAANAINNPFPISFPVPTNFVFPTPLQVISYDATKKYQTPVVYEWNLSVEHEFAGGFLMRTAYVGSHSSHIKESLQLDPAPVGSSGSLDPRRRLNAPFKSTFPKGLFGQVWMSEDDVNSSYNSLQASVEKRATKALTILASYTWAKSIDDLPVGGSVSEIGADQPSALPWDDPNRHAFDRGPSDFDRTNRFVASYVWQLPLLSQSNGFVRSTLGGWSLSGLLSAQTGDPVTVLSGLSSGSDASGTGLGRDRGFYNGASFYGGNSCGTSAHCVDFINRSAFVQPASGTFGNVGKGTLRGPGSFNWDMGLLKNFLLTERWKVQFRAEFFNVLNKVNLSDPTNTVNSGSFGRITSAGDPRIGQLALKVLF